MSLEQVKPDGLLHTVSAGGTHWGTANLGEAMPGVLTPLGWSIWGTNAELAVRATFAKMGSLQASDVVLHDDVNKRFMSIFYGRVAGNISFLCFMADRLPGTNAEVMAGQMLGAVPAGIVPKRDLSRLPAIAKGLPRLMVTVKKDVIEGTKGTKEWWTARLKEIPEADLDACQRLLRESNDRFREMVALQALGFFVGVQSLYDELQKLIVAANLPEAQANAIMAGQGSHAETEIIEDLWEVGRERMTLEAFLDAHGYHGPKEGEISGRVWREDPTPVLRMAAQYAERAEAGNPKETAQLRSRERIAAEAELLRRLPAWRRPTAKFILKLGLSRLPIRGVGKAAFLQSLDICRASSRRMGALLAEAGTLADPEDIFMFTFDELMAGLGDDAKVIAAERQALRAELEEYTIPSGWTGNPVPYRLDEATDQDAELSGIGASGGVVEGVVRVVCDPAFTDVEPDEIVVCTTTDPSWASILFLSAALVVDIGGKLSHAAVVAREVGIPCVINTGNGTKLLNTGDRVRVDGNKGTVEVLSRAAGGVAGDVGSVV